MVRVVATRAARRQVSVSSPPSHPFLSPQVQQQGRELLHGELEPAHLITPGSGVLRLLLPARHSEVRACTIFLLLLLLQRADVAEVLGVASHHALPSPPAAAPPV